MEDIRLDFKENNPRRNKLAKKILPSRTKLTDVLIGETKVMCRWRSSLWKLLWWELLIYTVIFLSISFIYRYAMDDMMQLEFERLVKWCGKQYTGLPLTFLLGFYVSLVVKRWWEQYCKLPWPDNIAIYLRGLVQGDGDEARLVRRTVVRYCLLSYILCIRRLSARLRKRFPSVQDIVNTGLVRKDEAVRIGDEESPEMYGSNWWMPLKWNIEIVQKAQKDGLINSAPGYAGLLGQLATFRSSLTSVATYGHIPVPLVYTQVVTLAVYVYFAVALIGEQWIVWRKPGDEIDLYYPLFMTVKFLFYFGWLRVAETLYNPFGEDDDDFELNELLNRHFKVALNIVDTMESPPTLEKDIFWGQPDPELVDTHRIESVYVAGDCSNGVDNKDLQATPEHISNPEDAISMAEKRDPMSNY